MSEHWYKVYTLPREIRCNANSNSSILIRKAPGDDDSITQADILIFAGKTLGYHDWTQLQRLRHSRQLWVHTTEESPFTSFLICPPRYMNIHFNLSFTYHPEADISVPYGQFVPDKQKPLDYAKSNFNKKTKLIVWVSSHCSTLMWRRSDFANDLSKYLPLDTYGACGTLNCPKHQKQCGVIFKSYKFYLAMENSCCGGYITEKFWKALAHLDAIPVVVGAPKRDYERLAPNNSFIHADDFGSMKELAEHILNVSKSKELYDSYFEWKLLGKATTNPINSILAFTEEGVCRLIENLESLDKGLHTVSSFSPYGPNWFGGCNECGEKRWLRNYSNFNYYDSWIKKKVWNV
ncbi:Glycoprotein 3-alpha-L-fucosyltransferase A [Holothuria leucospilota]|uniref:Fucosyltransferase n=1 Tax=Holothuria leucospilota TaxID=206669 RepID=A0A9Q1H585_HOLLE|nr:Glycoprotein 3-alpha-L-fucosyltransferase A [Holothuria leucospilota]